MAAKKQPLELVSTEKDKAKALATTLEKIRRRGSPKHIHGF